eukprot:2053247-Rhodomonas_salina.2
MAGGVQGSRPALCPEGHSRYGTSYARTKYPAQTYRAVLSAYEISSTELYCTTQFPVLRQRMALPAVQQEVAGEGTGMRALVSYACYAMSGTEMAADAPTRSRERLYGPPCSGSLSCYACATRCPLRTVPLSEIPLYCARFCAFVCGRRSLDGYKRSVPMTSQWYKPRYQPMPGTDTT